ncbi:hypothetical protein [Pseudomonas sp. PB3P13]
METITDKPTSTTPPAHRDLEFAVNGEFNLGTLTHDLDIDRQVKGMEVLGNDKILVAASFARGLKGLFGLLQLEPDGSPDLTFGDRGLALGSIANSYDCGAGRVVVQAPDIFMVGWLRRIADGPPSLVVTRFDDQGKIDSNFADNGHRVVDVPHLGLLDPDSSKLLALADGKILVSANYKKGAASTGLLVRIDDQGDLDPDFNGNGLLEIEHEVFTSTTANGFRVQADKQILVAGGAQRADSNVQGYVARYSHAGELDTGHGGPDVPGFSTMQVGTAALTFNGLLAPAEDKVIGFGQISGGEKDYAVLAGFDRNGGGYPEFNNGAPVLTSFPDELGSGWFDAHIQPDGKILCAGGPGRLYIVRYLASGRVDPSYGLNGLIQELLSLHSQHVFVRTQTNGRTILAANIEGLGLGSVFRYKDN